MRKADFKATFKYFYNNFEEDVVVINKISTSKELYLKEKRYLFELFVFGIAADWSILVYNLFTDCLNRDIKKYKDQTGYHGIKNNLSLDTCLAIVNGLKYCDLDSQNGLKVKSDAKKFLSVNPFKDINGSVWNTIKKFYIVRNYLAHYSDAQEKILRSTLKQKRLPIKQLGMYLYPKRLRLFGINFLTAARQMQISLGIPVNVKHSTLINALKRS